MIRTPDEAARYINDAPSEIERARRQREVFAEQQSILAHRLAFGDANGHLTQAEEQRLSQTLATERAKSEGQR